MNTTKGEWVVSTADNPVTGRPAHYVTLTWLETFGEDVLDMGETIAALSGAVSEEEDEANAALIALAGNLNQKYHLDKLEAGLKDLKWAWEYATPDELNFHVDEFIQLINRQPAGEKTEQ